MLERPLDSKSEDARNGLSSGRRLPTRQVTHTIQPLQFDCGGFFLGLKAAVRPLRFNYIEEKTNELEIKVCVENSLRKKLRATTIRPNAKH